MSLVVDYSIKAQVSDITIDLLRFKKELWRCDRRLYNSLKSWLDLIVQYRETTSYWIMQDPEVTVTRMQDCLQKLSDLIDTMTCYGGKTSELDPIKEKVDSVKLMVEMADHAESIFSNF